MKKLKLYLDTSVWNYVFADDAPEKKEVTLEFFDSVKEGVYELFISAVILNEIEKAIPEKARKLNDLIGKYQPQILPLTDEVEMLAARYTAEGIIPERKKDDAFHIAFTTAYELDALVSWNYKHLVNLRKKEMILSVNLKEGYLKSIEMITPMEVIKDED